MKQYADGCLKVPDLCNKKTNPEKMWITETATHGMNMKFMIEKNAGNYLFFSDLHMVHLNIPEFYVEELTAWDELHRVPILAKCIWCNNNIEIGGKSIFFEEFARKVINVGGPL